MGKGKPRQNPEKPQNNMSESCPYDDGSRGKECGYPWGMKCDGDRYKCRKLYFQHLATLSDEAREEFTERFGTKCGVPK